MSSQQRVVGVHRCLVDRGSAGMIGRPCALFPWSLGSVCTMGERSGLDPILPYNEEHRVHTWITKAAEVYVLMMEGVHTAVWSRTQSPTVEIKSVAARCVAIVSMHTRYTWHFMLRQRRDAP